MIYSLNISLLQKKLEGKISQSISNAVFDQISEGLRQNIKNENGCQENEMDLFHGTKQEAVKSILENGFDNR